MYVRTLCTKNTLVLSISLLKSTSSSGTLMLIMATGNLRRSAGVGLTIVAAVY